MKVHHIGYLVKDINQSIDEFLTLGFTIEGILTEDMQRNIKIQFLINNQTRIELISPMNEQANVSNILKKQGEGPYHVCYQTEDIERELTSLLEKKYVLVAAPTEAAAINNQRVAFLYKKGVGIIELLEEKHSEK